MILGRKQKMERHGNYQLQGKRKCVKRNQHSSSLSNVYSHHKVHTECQSGRQLRYDCFRRTEGEKM